MSELTQKLDRIHAFLDSHDLDALLLRRASSFSWATRGGFSHVNIADCFGQASLLVTRSERYLITDNIEAPRFTEEQNLADQGWEFVVHPWYEQDRRLASLVGDKRLGADSPYPGAVDLQGEVARMRAALLPEEAERFRLLSRSCAEAMDAAALSIHPGLTELQIAAILGRESWSRGADPVVNLIGTDERIFRFRHPLPTPRRLEKYAMLILCGRRWGLICSITRLIHFGPLPEELRDKQRAVAQVDAHLIGATRPGALIRDIFKEAMDCYALYGYPGEWQLHHQGGLAGYEPRELVATPTATEAVAVGQVYAWNPSITGTKSEDTILVGEEKNEILTAIPRWPVIKVGLHGQTIERPLILEIT